MTEEIPEIAPPKGLTIRYSLAQDAQWLKKWLSDPSIHNAFPMDGPVEIEDAVRRWISFSRMHASLTVEINDTPVGIATLYLQNYKRLLHQTEFGIILAPGYRGQGIGSYLLSAIMKLAKHQFNIELIHLQVYEDNPAKRLYSRFGFTEFGTQKCWIKDEGKYVGRTFMERFI